MFEERGQLLTPLPFFPNPDQPPLAWGWGVPPSAHRPPYCRAGQGPDHDLGLLAGLRVAVLSCVPGRSAVRPRLPKVDPI